MFWGCFWNFCCSTFGFFWLLKEDIAICLWKLSSSLRIRTARPSSYHEAKQAAVEYHGAKQTLFKAFQKAGLGAWVKKPIEQDQFSVTTWVSAAPVTASNFTLSGWKNNFPLALVRGGRMSGITDLTFLLCFIASCLPPPASMRQ